MTVWITAISAAHLLRGIAAAGGDAEAARCALGITTTPRFEDRITLDTLIDAWERAIATTRRRDLPVLAATRSNHDEHSLVGFCAVNQPTLGDAMDVLERYRATISNGYGWSAQDDGDRVRVRAEPIGPIDRAGWQAYLEFESIDLAAIARRVTRGRAVPIAASYVHAAHDAAPAIKRALGVAPAFRAEVCELVYPRSVRELPIEGAREQLALLVRDRLDALLRECEASVAGRVRARVPDLIRRGQPTVDAVARALAMSRRSLERALAVEATSVTALVDEARLHLARAWLPQLTVDEVARRLGYSDPRAFARAFRRWTGQPPSAWRP